jgi:maltooligosyltrehalose trehalohydrolase
MQWTMKMVGAFYEEKESLFRVWAPEKNSMELQLETGDLRRLPMIRDGEGYWEVRANVSPGTKYRYLIDGQDLRADPASLSQPEGVHGASVLLNRNLFIWTDSAWRGIALADMIIYEIHTGCFSGQHDFAGIRGRLDYLNNLGVNTIELMPVAAFPGGRNWGYDGAYPFTVQQSYGGADELKALVNEAHKKGIAVILDTVYNHVGPEGNYLGDYGPYFSDKHKTIWGSSFNLDDAWSDGVRNFILQNALMWLDEFHIDGLRLDAVHAIKDDGAKHLLQELKENVSSLENRLGIKKWLIAEIDLNDTRYIKDIAIGGYGLDGQWADDFHHALHSMLTGEQTGYYEDFGKTENLVKAITNTYVYDGNYSGYRKRKFGSDASSFSADHFVVFAQNHDQTGNRVFGERLTTLVSVGGLKLAAAVVLLSPYIPLLFMGEEYGEKRPFLYFADHSDHELIERTKNGRKKEFAQSLAAVEIPDPFSEDSFLKSNLSWEIENENACILLRWYQHLIHFRKTRKAMQGRLRSKFNAFSVSERCIVMERNFEGDLVRIAFNFADEPLIIPAENSRKIICILDSHAPEWNGIHSVNTRAKAPESTITVGPLGVCIYSFTTN